MGGGWGGRTVGDGGGGGVAGVGEGEDGAQGVGRERGAREE